MTPEEIRDGVEYLDACLRDIHTAAEGRSLDDAEQASFDEGLVERARLLELLERHNTIATLADVPASVVTPAPSAPEVIVRNNPFDLSDLSITAGAGEMRDRALRAVEAVDGLEDRHREQAEALVRALPVAVAQRIAFTGSPAYRSAFQKVVSDRRELLTGDERDALAAYERAASLTSADGGYAVPFTLDPTIIDTGSHSVNPFRQISRIVQTTTNSWNGVTSAGVTASWDGEAVEVSDDSPTLAQPSIPTFKGAAFVPFSIEIGGDWANMEADIRRMIAVAKDDLEGAAFATGNGTTAPQGIVTALDGTSSEIAPATAETFAIADVYAIESALKASARANASWVANKVWYNKIRQFDTNGGAGLWERIGAGQPGALLGYPAYESSNMDGVLPNAAATADNFGLVLGDFGNGYVIVDRVGLNVELIPHLFATGNNRPSGQRGFYAWWRVGAECVDTSAFAMLSIPTTA